MQFQLSSTETRKIAWHSNEGPRIILLHTLKGATQLECSKDMSAHVSTCQVMISMH